jgi:hypothetical protein
VGTLEVTKVPYATFTLRASTRLGGITELHKRLEADKSGALLPTHTVHSYVQEPARHGDLICVGIADTRALLAVVAEQLKAGTAKFRETLSGDAVFLYVGFDELDVAYYDPILGWQTLQNGFPA